jgi:hypothetical protein
MTVVLEAVLASHGVNGGSLTPLAGMPGALQGKVPGLVATGLWESLRVKFLDTGLWPVVRGEGEEFGPPAGDADETLSNVPEGSATDILSQQRIELREALRSFSSGLGERPPLFDLISQVDAAGIMRFDGESEPAEPWPASPVAPPAPSLVCAHRLDGKKPAKSVTLCLIPVQHPEDVVARLGFGGFNGCPMPEVIVGVLRDWKHRFGAVPASVTNDVLECVVSRPPQSEAEAMAIAQEHFAFCDDIVSQGTQSIRQLAIQLWRSPQWYFWWD